MTTTFPTRAAFTPKEIAFGFAFATLSIMILIAASALISGTVTLAVRSTPWALIIHVCTVIPALLLGAPVLMMKKGTRLHKLLGRIWATLMMITAISSFWLHGAFGGIGPIHILSAVTLISIPRAIWAIRNGNVKAHQRAMTGPYIGLFIAGFFSFFPGRLMGELLTAMF